MARHEEIATDPRVVALAEIEREARHLHRNLLRVFGRSLGGHDIPTSQAFVGLGKALAEYEEALAQMEAQCSTTP